MAIPGLSGGGGRNLIEIVLGLDDQASAQLDQASRNALNSARQMQRAGKQMMLAGGLVSGGMLAMARSSAKSGDEIAKMHDRTDIATETLSRLRHVANLSDTSIQGLDTGIKRMNRVILDASRGMETYTRTFDELGMNVGEILKMSPEERFFAIAKALSEVGDMGMRSAYAQELLGRSGTQILPMLARGYKAFTKEMKEAEKHTYIWELEEARAAEELNNSITRLTGTMEKLTTLIGTVLTDDLTKMVNKLTAVTVRISEMNPAVLRIATLLTGLAGVALLVGGGLMYLAGMIKAVTVLKAGWAAQTGATAVKVKGLTAAVGGLLWKVTLVLAALEAMYRLFSKLFIGKLRVMDWTLDEAGIDERDYGRQFFGGLIRDMERQYRRGLIRPAIEGAGEFIGLTGPPTSKDSHREVVGDQTYITIHVQGNFSTMDEVVEAAVSEIERMQPDLI